VTDINKTYVSPIPRSTLFQSWVSEKMVVYPAIKVESNPVAGGHFKLHAESPQGVFVMIGAFIEVVKHQKLQYTWHWEGTEEKTVVTVHFVDQDGGTRIDLNHTGFTSKESREAHDSGWDSYLEGLTQTIITAQ